MRFVLDRLAEIFVKLCPPVECQTPVLRLSQCGRAVVTFVTLSISYPTRNRRRDNPEGGCSRVRSTRGARWPPRAESSPSSRRSLPIRASTALRQAQANLAVILLPPWEGEESRPGFPILAVFRLKGQLRRDSGILSRSCKACQSPVQQIRGCAHSRAHQTGQNQEPSLSDSFWTCSRILIPNCLGRRLATSGAGRALTSRLDLFLGVALRNPESSQTGRWSTFPS